MRAGDAVDVEGESSLLSLSISPSSLLHCISIPSVYCVVDAMFMLTYMWSIAQALGMDCIVQSRIAVPSSSHVCSFLTT